MDTWGGGMIHMEYVEVQIMIDTENARQPIAVFRVDGWEYEIEKITDVHHAASQLSGGTALGI